MRPEEEVLLSVAGRSLTCQANTACMVNATTLEVTDCHLCQTMSQNLGLLRCKQKASFQEICRLLHAQALLIGNRAILPHNFEGRSRFPTEDCVEMEALFYCRRAPCQLLEDSLCRPETGPLLCLILGLQQKTLSERLTGSRCLGP